MTDLDDRAEVLEPGCTADVDLAEKAVLGSMLTSKAAAEEMLGFLDREDCFGPQSHRIVYAAIRHLAEEGLPVDLASVLGRIVATEVGEWRTGNAGVFLAGLMSHASPSYAWHAATVLREAKRRRLLLALIFGRQLASTAAADPDEAADEIRKRVDEALAGTSEATAAVTAGDLFISAIDRLESPEPPGVICFPWADLRHLVPWLRPGQLVTVAARPSLGKSLVAQDLARYTGLHRQLPCVLFSLEMDRDEVMDRLISAESGVLLRRITEKDLDDDAWARIAAARDRFADSKLVIDDTPRATIGHIRTRLRGMARRDPAQLAIVDYLQLMGTPARSENRQQEVAALVGGLKAIAREFRIPLVMLCQLNRGPEQRSDKRPHLSDARESGSVDNDSDVAILIHREDFYDPESPRAGEADLLVDKNRNGPRGIATVGFQGHYARFVDLTRHWTPSAALGNR